ncbi:tRNA (adenosine(37)-N6)-threonylcarbamoyltransferase complex dimerization subunit type 1 TsaB [uncultured Piscinibacter sp.]|uniref:tRNA (adenosine(37)-N6)-threonylcarbamoyltransferase complex dimerization subunit type 1 TsaB n=1 Tax=uncultured Piscinibacter sp. TaxID=1131835 RepID=UPI0026364EF0|nr:tRNA (adenosine(37)-N6)-threonylcarbamoyltransferase complex dimerization subunit type 1 TsaB [uncultured Piscinibacter sp.]
MTCLLAIDSSTEAMSIALSRAGETHVFEGEGGAQASARLLPELLSLLQRAGCTLREVDAVGFGRGPGAFTGLRSACSVAQGLALGAGKPVLSLDSLLLVAQDALDELGEDGADCWVAMDARMDEVYAAHYRFAAGRWQVRAAPMLCRPAALNERWAVEPPLLVAGTALDALGAQLHLATAQARPRTRSRARALARLAEAAWHDGGAIDAALALPVYLRDKVAQTTAEREAERSAKVSA